MTDQSEEEKKKQELKERGELDPYSRGVYDCLQIIKKQSEQERKTDEKRPVEIQTIMGNIRTTTELELKKSIKELYKNAPNETK